MMRIAELNYLLKRDQSDITVVAFIIMPGQTNNYNVESIKVVFVHLIAKAYACRARVCVVRSVRRVTAS